MRAADAAVILVGAVAFAWYGADVAGSTGAVIAGATGATLAYGTVRAAVRPGVAVSVLVGTAIGALIGSAIVRVLCLPGTCAALEVTSGIVTGVGAFVGVGLVVALVARSFDEYHEARAKNRPTKITGCGPEGDCD